MVVRGEMLPLISQMLASPELQSRRRHEEWWATDDIIHKLLPRHACGEDRGDVGHNNLTVIYSRPGTCRLGTSLACDCIVAWPSSSDERPELTTYVSGHGGTHSTDLKYGQLCASTSPPDTVYTGCRRPNRQNRRTYSLSALKFRLRSAQGKSSEWKTRSFYAAGCRRLLIKHIRSDSRSDTPQRLHQHR